MLMMITMMRMMIMAAMLVLLACPGDAQADAVMLLMVVML